jgi:hypothetical protein
MGSLDRAGPMTMHDQSDRTKSRLLRPTVLLLIVAIHAALLVVASRQVTRVDARSEEPLIFLALPDRLQVPTPAESAEVRPRKKPVAPRDSQFVTIPTPARPSTADNPPAPIDWNSEAGLAIKRQAELAMTAPPRALDKHGAGADLNGGLGSDREGKSDFGWDRSHTHRVEGLEGGGILIHINERCIVVLIPFPLPFCGIGKIPVRGDLLDHMHDEPQADANSKNTAP